MLCMKQMKDMRIHKKKKKKRIKTVEQYSLEPAQKVDISVEGIDKPINPEIDRRLRAGGL